MNTFCDDRMQDGSITIINIFELLKQAVLINGDKICVGSDDCRERDAFNSIMNN